MGVRPVRVVALSRPDRVSGVAVAVARASVLLPGDSAWTPLVIGPELDSTVRERSPWNVASDVHIATWPKGAGPVEQVMAVLTKIRALGAEVVIPNDCEHGFVAAAIDHVAGLRCGLWLHADHHDGDALVERCGELADSWRAVSAGGRTRAIALADRLELALPRTGEPMPTLIETKEEPEPVLAERATLAILYAGRLEKQVKRVMDLVRIADALVDAGTAFEMRIVGEGPSKGELTEAMERHIAAGRVRMEGAVALEAMPVMYAWADATLLVSGSEGMPTVVLESLAHGRVVLVSDRCGAATELVARERGRIGAVFPVGDARKAAGLLRDWALDRAVLAANGAAARTLAITRLSAEARRPAFEAFVAEAHAGARKWNPALPLEASGWWKRVLRAVEAIGPCSRGDLERLATEWMRASGIAMSGVWTPGSAIFPLELPGVPSPQARLVREAIERLLARGAQRIGVYGAGAHTRKMLGVFREAPQVLAIVDDRAGFLNGPSAEIGGLPVVSPEAAEELGLDGLLISSDEHERDMIVRARGWAKGLAIEAVYEPVVSA